jgi:soluble cytochrome b562
MTISGISNSSSSLQTWQASIQQRQQDFSQLAQALQGGNLAAAQSAFSALQNTNGQAQSSNATNGSNSNSSGNTISNDFAALAQALQSGNISSAQSAFAQLQTAMNAQQSGGHHHHHHHGGAEANSSNTNGNSIANSISVPDNSTISVSA